MPKFFDYLKPFGFGNPLTPWADDFVQGTPGEFGQRTKLRPEQEPLANQAINAGLNSGAGGAFGTAADYYRNNLSDNPADFDAFAAPEMRRYNEQIIPDLAEQFAGMGSVGLSSSGFRNSAVSAGTDLSERLGAIRANLRQQSAQGLMNVGNAGLQSFDENYYEPPTPGFMEQAAGPIAGAAMNYLLPGSGSAIKSLQGSSSAYRGQTPIKGSTSPYGKMGLNQAQRPGIGY